VFHTTAVVSVMTALVFETIAIVCLTIRVVSQTTALVCDTSDVLSHTIRLVCHTIGIVWLSKKVLCRPKALRIEPNRDAGSPPRAPGRTLARLVDAPGALSGGSVTLPG
jgi:hypothetical protein